MSYLAWFECLDKKCKESYPLDSLFYECQVCGSLLEVVHDQGRLATKSPDEWKQLFDIRKKTIQYPYGSGVWRYKELINPAVQNQNIISTYEGETNLYYAKLLGKQIGVPNLWVKLCGNSHTGSFKDLGMTVLISQVNEMIASGKNIEAVACASTGDTSAAVAAYAAAAGINSIVFLPTGKVSNEQLIQPISHGSIVINIDTDFDGCMAIVQKITEDNSIYLANSKNSLRVEGQKSVALEMTQQFGWKVPDTIIIPGGNLGNVAALGKGFLMMEELGIINKRPKIVVAQAENANPLYLSYKSNFEQFNNIQAKETLASAIQIGAPVSKDKAINILKQFQGEVEIASEQEIADACAISDKTGLYTCPHTGVAIAALFKLVKNQQIGGNEQVVIISTAHGLKFSNFKLNYHEKKLKNIRSDYSNLPIKLPNDYNQVRAFIDEKLKLR
ncbi:MAG: threonine synthase [Nitrospinota bacterium]